VTYCSNRYSAYTRSYLGERMLSGFLYLPYEWHLSQNSADLVLGVMWRQFFGTLINVSLQGLRDILIVVVMLTTLLVVEPFVSLLTILAVGGGAIIIFTTIRISLDQTATLAKEYKQSINRDVATGIHGLKDVKIFGREEVFTYNYRQRAYSEARIDAWQQTLVQLPRWILEILGFLMLASAICLMYFYMEASTARITGTMALLAVTAWRVLPAASNILGSLTSARNVIPYVKTGLDYLSKIETYSETISSHRRKEDVSFAFRESIRLDNVSFAYHGVEICALKNVNLTIEKGETVGIIGVSGAGKSTLVDLLLGLLAPTKGRILVDEQVLDNSIVSAWVRMIGYVQQSPYICDGTLAENVAFGLEGDSIDCNRVLKCCKMAAMEDFLAELPNGIDTPIGERGVKLSGGQRQRVAIARALYNYPEIMIFDEATSSLDTKSEKAIQQTIYSFKGKQTLIIIAHRLSTVEDCDKIIWLEKGGIVKTGTPDEILLEYRQLMKGEGQVEVFNA
jgi:ABC-type multidrug transport system fused ATPase/permease subunit